MSGRKSQLVACQLEGQLTIHAPPQSVGSADYHTLCSLDIDDPAIEHLPVELTARQQREMKINCTVCLGLFLAARKLRITDFSDDLRRQHEDET